MAPLGSRQIHAFTPSIPHHPNDPSSRPVPVTTSIDSRVFGELFAGTAIIFILAVLFWKVGIFIRSFNRHRLLKEGGSPKTRYARTWYGWVLLETHERNKRVFQKALAKVREWTAWKSTRTDYRWVWWDPGQEAFQERQRNRKPLRWLPKCFQSYDFQTADEIWNPSPPAQCHGALVDSADSGYVRSAETPRNRRKGSSRQPLPNAFAANEEQVRSPFALEKGHDRSQCSRTHLPVDRWESVIRSNTRLSKHLSGTPSHVRSLPILRARSHFKERRSLHQSPNHAQFHSQVPQGPREPLMATPGPLSEAQEMPAGSLSRINSKARQSSNWQRHRVWSAQMQVRSKRSAMLDFRDSSGPPGTPMTSVLGSRLSEQTSQIDSGHLEDRAEPQAQVIAKQRNQIPVNPRCDQRKTKYNTVPFRWREPLKGLQESMSLSHQLSSSCDKIVDNSLKRHVNDIWFPSENIKPIYVTGDNCNEYPLADTGNSVDQLCDWEVRLIDGLGRKLQWMFNELTPGQRPYHFAMLANHWLNRETWLVIDPVSRVSTDYRRHWGDPRFNVPYPEPSSNARPKYPVTMRQRAHRPRINSWRAAVNRQRRISGVRDVVRTVELHENSFDDPPDGKIDPGAWLLPKPPQGHELSTAQQNAWYEGGAGWQEKLEDWHQIRHGYLLRKFLHEGHVNRNHANHVAKQVGKRCHSASAKVILRKMEQAFHLSPPEI